MAHASGAPSAHGAQCPHDRRTVAHTRSPRANPWPSRVDAGEHLVAEDQLLLARPARCRTSRSAISRSVPHTPTSIGSDEHLVRRGPRIRHLGHGGRAVHARRVDERLHHAGRGARSTAPSAAEPTWAR